MSNTDFLGRAIDTVKKAIESDNEGEYEKAYQLYYSALELFMLALKWEKNPKSKEMIRAKTGEYMERAEKLKTHLASQDSRKKPSAVGANGKVSQGSGKGGYVVNFVSTTSGLERVVYCLVLLTVSVLVT
jgi:vacuolar protein-sorting-associated protein 4